MADSVEPQRDLAGLQRALLSWFSGAQRDLPWRRPQSDAYAVWISEVMLQQTTVAAVIPFFGRWMARFPTVESVARAPVDEVLRYWAGLGYYSRARNIKRAAERIVETHGGALPSDVDALRALPGIGRYTAGAIASIAYNVDAPILDANVTRVLCRLEGILAEDTGAAAVQARLWALARRAIPDGQARDFNQALMELGALVCTPRSPGCARCPAAPWCAARAFGRPEAFPAERVAKRWRAARHAALAIVRDDRLLLVRRRDDARLWAGLWEMPRAVAGDGESLRECARRAARETLGLDIEPRDPFGTVKHVVTDTKITLTGFDAAPALRGEICLGDATEFVWADARRLGELAIASPQRRLIALWPGAPDSTQPALRAPQ